MAVAEQSTIDVKKAGQVKPTLAYSSYLQGGVSTSGLFTHSEIVCLVFGIALSTRVKAESEMCLRRI